MPTGDSVKKQERWRTYFFKNKYGSFSTVDTLVRSAQFLFLVLKELQSSSLIFQVSLTDLKSEQFSRFKWLFPSLIELSFTSSALSLLWRPVWQLFFKRCLHLNTQFISVKHLKNCLMGYSRNCTLDLKSCPCPMGFRLHAALAVVEGKLATRD